MSEYEKSHRSKGPIIAAAIAVVAILLAISLCLLLFQNPTSEQKPLGDGNAVSSTKNDLIALADKNADGDVRFNIGNMFPGDRETKHAYIGIKDGGVKALSFGVNTASETKEFSKVMGICVVANGTAIYDGLVKDMPASVRTEIGEDVTEVDYEISLYLDTSVGNEYQGASLALNFDWWVEDSDYVASAPDQGGDQSSDTTKKPTLTIDLTGEGDKCVPWCVGMCPWCAALPFAAVAAVALIVGAVVLTHKISKKQEARAAKKMQKNMQKMQKAEAVPVDEPSEKTNGEVGLAVLFGLLSIGSSFALNSVLKQTHKIKKNKPRNNTKKKK